MKNFKNYPLVQVLHVHLDMKAKIFKIILHFIAAAFAAAAITMIFILIVDIIKVFL